MMGMDEIGQWFVKRIPKGWFTAVPEVLLDDDEILVVGHIGEPDGEGGDAARVGAIRNFREDTRARRIEIASEAEAVFARKVSWGARCGDVERTFTALSIPVMTRLRLPERRLLDTLVLAGVARSRSEALAWCVRLVAGHEADWLADLEAALASVHKVRAEGPRSSRTDV
jgi:hypothetical protein